MIISFYATKSSTKTSLAISTAIAIKSSNKSVIVIDADTQASASNWLELRTDDPITCVKIHDRTITNSVKEFSNHYENIIIDCGGKNDQAGRLSLIVADIAIIPVFPSGISLITLENSLSTAMDAKSLNPNLKILIVLVGAHSNPRVKDADESKELILESITGVSDVRLAESVIVARKIWSDIFTTGKGITESGHQPAIDEFNALFEEINSWR